MLNKKHIIILATVYLVFVNNKSVNNIYAKNIFRIGERMIYALKWNKISIGVDILELDEIKKMNSQTVYHIYSKTNTQGFINTFFTVRDLVETYIDTSSYLPVLYRKDINEGKYHKKAYYEFNHNKGFVATPWGRYRISKDVQDPLSILAYFRTLDIKLNDIIDIKYFSGTKTDVLRIHVVRKELKKTPAGNFNTNVVAFSVGKKERKYLKKKINLWIWFTDDDRRIPVFAKSNTAFGAVTGTLIDYVPGE